MITEFRNLCAAAELEDKSASDNRHLIKMFANCLNPQLKKRILFGEVVLKDIVSWINKAIQFDTNYRMGQALTNMKGERKPQRNGGDKDPNVMDTSIGALTEKDKVALMKIGACFRCRKTGHLSRDCPDKNKNTQMTVQGQAPKKSTPKDIHGNIRGLTKEERAELMALMTADTEDF